MSHGCDFQICIHFKYTLQVASTMSDTHVNIECQQIDLAAPLVMSSQGPASCRRPVHPSKELCIVRCMGLLTMHFTDTICHAFYLHQLCCMSRKDPSYSHRTKPAFYYSPSIAWAANRQQCCMASPGNSAQLLLQVLPHSDPLQQRKCDDISDGWGISE